MRIDPRSARQESQAHRFLARHPVWRLARGAVLGVLAVALAGAGHAAGGGQVAASPLILLTLVSCTVAMVLSARPWRLPPLLMILAGEQAICHFALMRWGMSGNPATSAHQMPMSMPMAMPGMAGMPHADGNSIDPRTMFLAHVVATLVAAVVLHRGDQALVAVARLLGSHLARPARSAAFLTRFPEPMVPWFQEHLRGPEVFVGLVPSRGPPA